MIRYLLAAPIVLGVALLVVGTVRGRVRIRSCCAADASLDLRMRGTGTDGG